MPGQIDCPKCDAGMSGYLGDTSATCLSCAGTWIPAAALVSRLGQITGRDVADELAILLATGARMTSFRCPDCPSGALHAVTLRGIEIDSCLACHGVFLDRGEAERLRAVCRRLRPVAREDTSTRDGYGARGLALDLVFALADLLLPILL